MALKLIVLKMLVGGELRKGKRIACIQRPKSSVLTLPRPQNSPCTAPKWQKGQCLENEQSHSEYWGPKTVSWPDPTQKIAQTASKAQSDPEIIVW